MLPLEMHLAAIYALLKDHAVQEPNFKVCFPFSIRLFFGQTCDVSFSTSGTGLVLWFRWTL